MNHLFAGNSQGDILLIINNLRRDSNYTAQVKRLQERGCKIDIMGIQMHIFDTKKCQAMAEGAYKVADGWKDYADYIEGYDF